MARRQTPPGERRVLTLLFSDLAGSSELAALLDPEDLRDVYQQTREIAFAAVERFGGRVKDYIGDGIIVYFGFPVALERGAQAAVNAALEMVREVSLRRWPLVERTGRAVQMRVGIHTGEVVVGDIGRTGGAHEADAIVGTAPIIANRLQAIAAPNSVAISQSTFELIEGQYECRRMEPAQLKGVSEPMTWYEVVSTGGVKLQTERILTRQLQPLVGRAAELKRLRAAWRVAVEGGHSGVCVAGEPGIGKSRLMAELKASLHGGARVWEFQCSPYQTNTAWFPIAETLREQICGFTPGDTLELRSRKLETAVRHANLHEGEQAWLLSELLGLPYPEAELAAALAPEARKRKLLESLVLLFEKSAEGEPVLCEVNDAHWIDASTADWLSSLHRRRTPGVMVAITTRPGAPASDEWGAEVETILLSGLSREDVEALAHSVAGGRVLPHEILAHLALSCSGVPLFVEEMMAALVSSGALVEHEDHYELEDWHPARQLPFSLRDLLQTRLDQLDHGDRELVQSCAVIGSEVTPQFVAVVLEEAGPERTEAAFHRLVALGFFACDADSGTFTIRHALIRNAAYESLLRTARANLHRRVAEIMMQTGSAEGLRVPPELLAEHFTQAGMLDAAAPLWLQSAHQALRRSAVAEAVALARRGLEVLAADGQPARLHEVRVALVTTLGTALIASKGFASPEAARTFKEAERLLATTSDPAQRFPAMWGQCITHLMQGQLNPALEYATRMLEIGRVVPGGNLLIEALWTRGDVLFWLGRLDEAEAHLEEAVAMYRPEQHHQNAHVFGQDPGVAARVYLTQLRAFRLQAAEARECARECLELAQSLRHPHSLAWAMASATMLKLLFGEVDGALESGPRTIEYCMKQEHPFWLAATKLMTGWALSRKGRAEEGLRMAREGFALYERLGTNLILPVFCVLLADCCLAVGDAAEAAAWAARGRDMVERNNERLSLPAVLMIDGQLMENAGGADAPRAESCYREALECARAQGARLREVQAAALLAQWLAANGRPEEAQAALLPCVPWLASPDLPECLRPLAAFLTV